MNIELNTLSLITFAVAFSVSFAVSFTIASWMNNKKAKELR